jgi:hypothetical protein
MRRLARDYVWALHSTYLEQVRHLPPGDRASLPLIAARDVVAAAAHDLHLVAISGALPHPVGSEVLYHLTVVAEGGLDAHHAQHSNVGLANLHARRSRKVERLRRAMPRAAGAVDELGICVRSGSTATLRCSHVTSPEASSNWSPGRRQAPVSTRSSIS